jgi:hypothetical protein
MTSRAGTAGVGGPAGSSAAMSGWGGDAPGVRRLASAVRPRLATRRTATMPIDSSMALGSRLAPPASRGMNRRAIATKATMTIAATMYSTALALQRDLGRNGPTLSPMLALACIRSHCPVPQRTAPKRPAPPSVASAPRSMTTRVPCSCQCGPGRVVRGRTGSARSTRTRRGTRRPGRPRTAEARGRRDLRRSRR